MSGFDQFGQQPPGQPQPYGPPQQQPASNRGAKVGLVLSGVALLLLGVCIVGCGWNLFFGDGEEPEARPTATVSLSAAPSPSAEPAEYEPEEGDCVRNTGTQDRVKLEKAACGPGTYKILVRIPFTDDPKRCTSWPGAKGYDIAFYTRSTRSFEENVLCAKRQ
jgi:hypothetical protein